jgi:Ion channel
LIPGLVTSHSQDVAVLPPLVISLATTLTTILIHAIALFAVVHLVRRQRRLGRAGVRFSTDVAIVVGTTLLVLIAHLVEITIWALVLIFCGEFAQLGVAFYHSAMNYTSLGYGDIVMSRSWRLLGPLETTDGMLMFGVSTATIFAVISLLIRTKYRIDEL